MNDKPLFWNSKELIQMHIELTNACNAACPMCVRFYNNSPLVRPDLEIGQITYDKFVKWFPPEVIERCHLLLFCGVHGDAGTARDTYEIFEYISNIGSNTAIRMNTNGGMRRPDWWYKMGQLFSKYPIESCPHYWALTFSIDGLEDTNHLYRRNVDWNILMDNVKAFIDGGGTAVWDYLIFKHNEHQIDDAKKLSEELGFKEFIPKKALGVDNNFDMLKPLPVMNKEGQLDYIIEAPSDPKNRNLENPKGTQELIVYSFTPDHYRELKISKQIGKDFDREVERVYESRIAHEDLSRYDNYEIKCKSKVWSSDNGKEIFVDNFGRVMPCCYIGTHLNGVYSDTRTLQLHHHMTNHGWDKFSLENHSLKEILDGGHLDRVFADSWEKENVKCGKLIYCSDTCGQVSSIDKIFTHELNFKARPRDE